MAVQLDQAEADIVSALDTAIDALLQGGAEYPPATSVLRAFDGYDKLANTPSGDVRPLVRDAFKSIVASLMTYAVTWVSAALTNSWANYGSGWPDAAYAKNAVGDVMLKGLIKAGTLGATALTLPAGMRPIEPRIFTCMGFDGFSYIAARVDVRDDGSVQVVNVGGGSNTWVSLENIRFRAEQ